MKHQEYIGNRKSFVLLRNNTVLGTFGNLRKVINFMKDEKFYSYWTVIRIKEDKYPIVYQDYSIFKVKHY